MTNLVHCNYLISGLKEEFQMISNRTAKNLLSFEVFLQLTYRTRTNKWRSFNSKIIIWALRLSHKKHIKNEFQHEFLGGRPLIESAIYWRGYGLFVCLFVTEVTCTATSVDGLRLRKGATTRELGQSPRNMSAIDGKQLNIFPLQLWSQDMYEF